MKKNPPIKESFNSREYTHIEGHKFWNHKGEWFLVCDMDNMIDTEYYFKFGHSVKSFWKKYLPILKMMKVK